MIPGSIRGFLEEEATVAVAGTRDADNIPHVHRVSGWRVGEDDQTISCFIPADYTDGLISSLEGNGQFALTLEQLGSHKTYQFKGDYLDAKSAGDSKRRIAEAKRELLGSELNRLFGLPIEVGRAYLLPPDQVVRFKVREIFMQTPGPGAGQRLVPPEGGAVAAGTVRQNGVSGYAFSGDRS